MTTSPPSQFLSTEGPAHTREVQTLFNRLAPSYDHAVAGYSLGQDLRWRKELIDAVDPRPGERALDLACGTGLVLNRLEARVGPGGALGIDQNWAMLDRARANGRSRRLLRANVVYLPFRDSQFDLVTAGYLLKYVSLPKLAAEVHRVLRPGGRFGGYDFSRPTNGLVGTGYSVYLHHVLPRLARESSADPTDLRRVFDFIGHTAENSGWESRAKDCFEAAGFDRVQLTTSLGGASTRVVATRT